MAMSVAQKLGYTFCAGSLALWVISLLKQPIDDPNVPKNIKIAYQAVLVFV
jgi:hypothetical protein